MGMVSSSRRKGSQTPTNSKLVVEALGANPNFEGILNVSFIRIHLKNKPVYLKFISIRGILLWMV